MTAYHACNMLLKRGVVCWSPDGQLDLMCVNKGQAAGIVHFRMLRSISKMSVKSARVC